MGDDVDFRVGLLAPDRLVNGAEHLVELREDAGAVVGEIRHDLHVAQVGGQQRVKVELEDARFFREKEQVAEHGDGVDHFIEHDAGRKKILALETVLLLDRRAVAGTHTLDDGARPRL